MLSSRRGVVLRLSAVVVLVLAAVSARAGTVIDVKTVYFDGKRADETSTIAIDANCVRFDGIEAGRKMAIIFRIDEKRGPVCWVIDKGSNTYVEFTRETADKIQARADEARRQFEEQMESAPPKQREQIRKTMEARGDRIPGELAEAQFKRIASGVKLNRWTCTQYEAQVNGRKQEDLWVAAEGDLGLTSSDIRVLREMGLLFSEFSAETNAFFQIGRSAKGGFEGFPVVVVEYKGDAKTERSEVTDVRKLALAPALFELPQDARQQKMYDQ
jgi:hypothetical protein